MDSETVDGEGILVTVMVVDVIGVVVGGDVDVEVTTVVEAG